MSAGRLVKSLCPLSQFFLRTPVSRLTYVKKNGLVDTGLFKARSPMEKCKESSGTLKYMRLSFLLNRVQLKSQRSGITRLGNEIPEEGDSLSGYTGLGPGLGPIM